MFEKYTKGLPFEVSPSNVFLSMDDTNLDSIKNRLFNLENLSDQDLFNLVRKSYSYLFDEIFVSKNTELISFLYTNPRFIMALTNVIPQVQLSYLQIVYCNKLAYDYFTGKGQKDKYIYTLLINLVKMVNRSILPGLIGLGLNEELACRLINARYSSLKENIQVMRLNLIIIQQPSDTMTVQMIVDIYGKLFDRITPLFEGIMYDYWCSDQFVNSEMEEVYGTVNTAIIEIVNNLPEDIMYHLLNNFNETYHLINKDKKIRFNIYSFCEEDYPRLAYILEMIKREGTILPRA